MKIARGLALAVLLGVLGASQAQLKPSAPATPPLPASQPDALKNEALAIKGLAARAAAEKWLALLDNGEYGTAWDQCSKLFRERVTRTQWVEGLPNNRGALGAMKSRRYESWTYKTSLPGTPQGEYMTLQFTTGFEKKDDAEELVTMVFEDGEWRALGYGAR